MSPDPRTPTEFALASDGILYINEIGGVPAGRSMFVGYALLPDEAALIGARQLLAWTQSVRLALGSDGSFYVEEGAIDIESTNRRGFRGYAATPAEAAIIAEEIHRMAFNATCALRRPQSSGKRRDKKT